jgi:hypothetical protein
MNVARCQENLGLRIRLDELFGERNGWPVTYSLSKVQQLSLASPARSVYLAMPEQLIPLFSSELSLTVKFRGKSILPHQAIGRVLDTGGHHVVRVTISQLL